MIPQITLHYLTQLQLHITELNENITVDFEKVEEWCVANRITFGIQNQNFYSNNIFMNELRYSRKPYYEI